MPKQRLWPDVDAMRILHPFSDPPQLVQVEDLPLNRHSTQTPVEWIVPQHSTGLRDQTCLL
jgi:hypothetical protein